jgi:hypothetical protein
MHELHDELQRHAPNTYSAAAGASNARCCFVGSLTLCFTTLSFFSGFLLGDTPSWSRGREAAPPVEPSGANAAGAAAAAASVSVLAPDASSCAEGSGVEAASASAPSAASPPAVDDAASACAVAWTASAPVIRCGLLGEWHAASCASMRLSFASVTLTATKDHLPQNPTSTARREEAAVRRLATQICGPHTRKPRFQLCHFSVATS